MRNDRYILENRNNVSKVPLILQSVLQHLRQARWQTKLHQEPVFLFEW